MFDFSASTVKLEPFEGPIDLLLYLVQRHELNIFEILLQEITQQWQSRSLDESAEFLIPISTLLLLKSQALLPPVEKAEEEEPDPQFDLVHHVADYCRFREAAKGLVSLESSQLECYHRGAPEPVDEIERPTGLHHLSLGDLALLLSEVLERASERGPGIIPDEEWKVSDAMEILRHQMASRGSLLFADLFQPTHSRRRIIASFLALLELMKLGEIAVVQKESVEIICKGRHHDD